LRKIIIYVLALLLILCIITGIASVLIYKSTMSSKGKLIYGIGLGVYSDAGCTTKITLIDWGNITPSSTNTKQVYIKNENTTNFTLALTEQNWIPVNISTYLTLTWDYTNQTMKPNDVLAITFILEVSNNIIYNNPQITDFSFDIVITAVQV